MVHRSDDNARTSAPGEPNDSNRLAGEIRAYDKSAESAQSFRLFLKAHQIATEGHNGRKVASRQVRWA